MQHCENILINISQMNTEAQRDQAIWTASVRHWQELNPSGANASPVH